MSKRDLRKTECVVVLGAPRSGTSLIAGILSRLGVDMGTSMRPTDPRNPDGYYEDLDWRTLNRVIVSNLGGSWCAPPKPGASLQNADAIKERIEELVAQKSERASGPIWGFKDPCTCLTLPILAPYLPRTLFIRITRNRDATVQSLTRHINLPLDATQWGETVDAYNDAAISFLRNNPGNLHQFNYALLTTDSWGSIIDIANAVNVTNRDTIVYAAEFVHPMRHAGEPAL